MTSKSTIRLFATQKEADCYNFGFKEGRKATLQEVYIIMNKVPTNASDYSIANEFRALKKDLKAKLKEVEK